MRKEIVVCDICGAERKQANHWFCGLLCGRDLTTGNLVPVNRGDESAEAIEFKKWSSSPIGNAYVHLCGQTCAQKLLDEFLSK